MPNRSMSGAGQWWLGAPLLGVMFGIVANHFFPTLIESLAMSIYRASGNDSKPVAFTPETTRFLAPLVGILLAVSALAALRVLTLLRRSR